MQNETIESLVSQHTEELYKRAYYKTSSINVAEDLVQETFLAAVEKKLTFKGESSPKTWLFSILNNKIIDFYRKKSKQHVKLEGDLLSNFFDETGTWKNEKRPKDWYEDEEHLLDNSDFLQTLKNCMSKLPEKWNSCINLKFLSEKKSKEICQEIGISPTNFWQILHRAKLKLRECIENNWINN